MLGLILKKTVDIFAAYSGLYKGCSDISCSSVAAQITVPKMERE